MPTSKYNYQPYQARIRHRWFLIAILVFVSFLLGVIGGWYLLESAGKKVLTDKTRISDDRDSAYMELSDLKRQLAIYENSGQVDRMAAKHTQDELLKLQDKLADLSKELEFYKRIISPEHRNYELRIQNFRLIENQGHKFVLTVSQGIGRVGTVSGTAKVYFKGLIDGAVHRFSIQDLDPKKRSKLHFSFRYFQTLTGDLLWPEKFELESVEVIVKSTSGKSAEISKQWSVEELQKESEYSNQSTGDSKIMN